jgi:mannose-6-phosphate isomerase
VLHPVPGGALGTGQQADEPGLVYPTPVDDFQLSRLDLSDQPIGLPAGRPQILLCITGTADLRDNSGHSINLSKGQSVYLSASDTGVTIAGPGTTLRATVGI